MCASMLFIIGIYVVGNRNRFVMENISVRSPTSSLYTMNICGPMNDHCEVLHTSAAISEVPVESAEILSST